MKHRHTTEPSIPMTQANFLGPPCGFASPLPHLHSFVTKQMLSFTCATTLQTAILKAVEHKMGRDEMEPDLHNENKKPLLIASLKTNSVSEIRNSVETTFLLTSS